MEDDGDDKDDSKRRTRNLSEKKRRDQFNMLVHELGTMIATNNRKMDKSTILKSTIAFLKNHNELTELARAHDVQEEWKPAFLSNEEFIYLVLEALEGFVIVFSALGRIYYVSESVASLLGHNPNDVMNKNIFDFVYEEDRTNLYGLLQHPDMSVHAPPGANTENEIRFHCHLRRGTLDFRDEVTYELIQFNGHFRTDIEQNENCDLSFEDENESRLIYFCIAKLCTPQLVRDVSLADANRKEFTSRHSLEWKFLFLDHRAPPIIGYLPFEVLGTSGYDYYHFDDLEKVVTCHEALMQKGELTSCYYRFLTKGQQWIWLQSRFYITYHQWHSKPEFVVCTHRVVSYVDVDTTTKQEITEQEITDQDIRNEPEASLSEMKEPSPEPMISVSPPYMSDTNEVFGNYQSPSQAQSVKSTAASAGSICATVATVGTATTTAASWPRASQIRYTADSDTASVSGESRSSQRNGSQEVVAISVQDTQLVPQHNIGAQYLEPVPYVGAVGMPGVLPLPISTLPVIVSPGQAQIQLQRTHRELQHMIVRQQEELRQVKEQLMLARLGIFQPIINVQDHYGHAEEMLHASRIPAQIVYDGTQPRALAGFPPHQLHPSQPQLLPSQSQLLPSQPQLLPSQPQLLSTQSQLLPSQPQLLPAQPHPMQTLPTQLHLTQMHPQQQHTSTQHSSLQHPSQQHSSQQYSSQQLSSQQQPSQQQVSQKHPFQQHQSQQHQSHQQQQSQQHQLLQNQSLQNQSLQNQSLQNQSQQHPSQQHTSQQNQLQQHQTQQNQAQQNQLQQHQSQQHQSQQHKSHQHPSQQHSAQQQTSQQHPSQQHPSQQDLSQQHPAQQQTLQQQTFEQQTLQQQTLQQQTLQQQTLQQQTLQQQTLQQQTLQHQTLQQQTLQLQTLQQQTLQHQKLQQQTLQLQTLQQQTLQQQTLKQQTLQQQTLQQQTSQQHSLQQHLSQQHPSQHHSTQQHPSQQQSLQQQSLQQQSLQQHLSQQHLSQQHPSQQNQVQQHPTQSHLSQLQQQLQAHHDLQNQYNANLSHSPQ